MDAGPRSTRRQFLQGKSAADALADLAAAALPADALPAAEANSYLVHLSRRAMACNFEIFLNAGQYEHGTETALEALDLVDRLEDQLSIFRERSEISRLNRHAAEEAVTVEPRLFELLALAQQIHADTGGAYDVTSAQLSHAWGFSRRSGALPSQAAIDAARALVGSEYLDLDPDHITLRFLKSGVAVNLGSIGKGYALDRVCELFEAKGIRDFLLHGGNSSVLARGGDASLTDPGGWRVGVRDPLRPDRRLGHLLLRDRALATSGSGTQFFMHEGRRFGHILDPRSGWPAEGVLSVTVLAPTAAEADALSTAFYVMGPEQARAYCEAHAGISALVFCPGARPGAVEQHLLGIDADDWIAPGATVAYD